MILSIYNNMTKMINNLIKQKETKMEPKLTNFEAQILDMIKVRGDIGAASTELAQTLGSTENSVRRRLTTLRRYGKVKADRKVMGYKIWTVA